MPHRCIIELDDGIVRLLHGSTDGKRADCGSAAFTLAKCRTRADVEAFMEAQKYTPAGTEYGLLMAANDLDEWVRVELHTSDDAEHVSVWARCLSLIRVTGSRMAARADYRHRFATTLYYGDADSAPAEDATDG